MNQHNDDDLEETRKFVEEYFGVTEAETKAAENAPIPEITHANPADYDTTDVEVVEARDLETDKSIRLVLRREKSDGYYMWFISDVDLGLISLDDLGGWNYEEVLSECELYFGLLNPARYQIRAGKWYRYGNKVGNIKK